jgi:hypothetical protein
MSNLDVESRGPRASYALAAAAVLLLADPAAVSAQPPPEPSARDFTGVYFPAGFGRRTPNPLPYTAGAQALAAAYEQQFKIEDDPGLYCIWPGMPRAPWGAPFAIEIFHRPHDLTIFWEGYGMYRKVYMAGENAPEPILPTAMGHSLARWEGDVLVIETTNLRPYPYMNRVPNTSDARVVERMWLEEREEDGEVRKYLIDEVTLTDPKLYTEPVRSRAEAVYRPDLQILEYTCSVSLWEAYLEERGLTLPDVDALPGGN